MRHRPLFTLLAALLALSGCGGGGGGGGSVPGPGSTTAPTATARLVLIVPPATSSSARARRPAYVSPATKSIAISVAGGGRFVSAVSSSTPGCVQGAQLVCTIEFPAPLGSDTLTVSAYASTDGSGTPLSTSSLVITVNPGVVNSVTVTLSGVVASLRIPGNPISFTAGQASSAPLTVEALDASGNVIVGPGGYSDASGNAVTITLADSDSSGATSVAPASLTAPSTAVTISYNGAAIGNFTITASAPGAAPVVRTVAVTATPQPAYILDAVFTASSTLEFWNVLDASAGTGLGNRTDTEGGLRDSQFITANRLGDLYIGGNVPKSNPVIQHFAAPATSHSTITTYTIQFGVGALAEDSGGGLWVGATGTTVVAHYPANAQGPGPVPPDRTITGIAGLPPTQSIDGAAVSVDSQDRVYVVAGTPNTSSWRVYVLPANADGVATPVASYPYDKPPAVLPHVVVDQHDDTLWEFPANAYGAGDPVGTGSPAFTTALVATKQNAVAPYRAIIPSSAAGASAVAFDDRQNLFVVQRSASTVDVFTPAQSGVAAPVQSTYVQSSAAIAIPVTHFTTPSGPPGGSANGAIAPSPSSFSFLASGQAYASALAVSESGYGGGFAASSSNTAVATVVPGSTAQSFKVTPVNAGTAVIRVRDAGSGYVDVPVTVSITGLTVQGRRR